MTTTASAAGPAVGQKPRGQHEETGLRVEVARLRLGQRRRVGGQDLRAPGVIRGEPGRVRLGTGAVHPTTIITVMEIDRRVARHYEVIDESDRLAKPGLGDLVRLRTWDVFDRFLPAGGSRLDVGGATGVHSEYLAEAGHDVLLVEPVTRHVEAARARSAGRFRVEQGEARALPVPDASVDGVLLMGPLYHLIDRADRIAALREAIRVLRPGGVLLGEVIARHAWVLDATKQGLLGDPEVWEEFDRTIGSGLTQDPLAPREGGFFAYFHRMEELREELVEVGGRDVELVAVEGFGWLLDDLPGRMRSAGELIRAIRLTESEPSMLGVSAHVIGVARV